MIFNFKLFSRKFPGLKFPGLIFSSVTISHLPQQYLFYITFLPLLSHIKHSQGLQTFNTTQPFFICSSFSVSLGMCPPCSSPVALGCQFAHRRIGIGRSLPSVRPRLSRLGIGRARRLSGIQLFPFFSPDKSNF
jgi:hypothetical protein